MFMSARTKRRKSKQEYDKILVEIHNVSAKRQNNTCCDDITRIPEHSASPGQFDLTDDLNSDCSMKNEESELCTSSTSDYFGNGSSEISSGTPSVSSDKAPISERIARWALSNDITHSAIHDLLAILRSKLVDLPKDRQSLLRILQTDNQEMRQVADGGLANPRCINETVSGDEESDISITSPKPNQQNPRVNQQRCDDTSMNGCNMGPESTSHQKNNSDLDSQVAASSSSLHENDTEKSCNDSIPRVVGSVVHGDLMQRLLTKTDKILRRGAARDMQIREIKEVVQQICVFMKTVNSHFNVSAPVDLPDLFPIKNKQELDDFERQVLVNPQILEQTILALKDVGGDDCGNFARRAMPRLLLGSFGERCNLSGKHDKIPLGGGAIFKAVFYAAKMNILTKDVTEKQMEKAVRNYLSSCRDRKGGSRQKKSPKARTSMLEDFGRSYDDNTNLDQ